VVIGEPHVRFYAGIPLHAADGARVGAFCIVDSKPRSLSAAQLGMLKDMPAHRRKSSNRAPATKGWP
jgi:GAF domain-containing protein